MSSVLNTLRLEKELIARGLLPDRCHLVEIRIEPNSALMIRYEVFVTADKLSLYADAMKAAAAEVIAEDERRLARVKSHEVS